jgi:hypothetical protein
MDRQELVALAERVEKASGPDRELDRDIWETVLPVSFSYAYHQHLGMVAKSLAQDEQGRIARARTIAVSPKYTASLDSAMTLVPEGVRFILDSDGCHCRITKPSDKRWPWNGYAGLAATPTLALTAASLRALAAKTPDHG